MVVGILALSQALESLVLLLDVGTGPALEWMARTMASAPPLGLALAVVVVGLFAPVGEELFFRGYMLTRLRQVWSPGPAILVSAVAFGIIHGEWVHGLLAAGIGVYLGLVTERSGSVVPAMICHGRRLAIANPTASPTMVASIGFRSSAAAPFARAASVKRPLSRRTSMRVRAGAATRKNTTSVTGSGWVALNLNVPIFRRPTKPARNTR